MRFLFWRLPSSTASWARIDFGDLGAAWGMEKTKYGDFSKAWDVFALYRLPGAYGCLVFNKLYPTGTEVSLLTHAEIERIIEEMRIQAGNAHIAGSENRRLNKLILWYSRKIAPQGAFSEADTLEQNRVALSAPIIRAYLSQCWNCENCSYDCRSVSYTASSETNHIRGPCARRLDKAKENRNE